MSSFLRKMDSASQSEPCRKRMISMSLVLPALFRVCFSVDCGSLSANKTFSPSCRCTALKRCDRAFNREDHFLLKLITPLERFRAATA